MSDAGCIVRLTASCRRLIGSIYTANLRTFNNTRPRLAIASAGFFLRPYTAHIRVLFAIPRAIPYPDAMKERRRGPTNVPEHQEIH